MNKDKQLGLIVLFPVIILVIVIALRIISESQTPMSPITYAGSAPRPSPLNIPVPSISASPLPGNQGVIAVPTHSTISTWSQISQADQTRMREIITGVIQNTIPVTSDIKNELKSIFAKYNATDAEISDFATYSPAFEANYQRLFYTDALQAVSIRGPVKSSERLALEKEALSRGLMTSAKVESNDILMAHIALHTPVTGPDGNQFVFTTDSITSTLNNIDLIEARLRLLLE